MHIQGDNFKLAKDKHLTLINSSFIAVALIFTSFFVCNYRGVSDPRDFQILSNLVCVSCPYPQQGAGNK